MLKVPRRSLKGPELRPRRTTRAAGAPPRDSERTYGDRFSGKAQSWSPGEEPRGLPEYQQPIRDESSYVEIAGKVCELFQRSLTDPKRERTTGVSPERCAMGYSVNDNVDTAREELTACVIC
jgi:hypothetical protein